MRLKAPEMTFIIQLTSGAESFLKRNLSVCSQFPSICVLLLPIFWYCERLSLAPCKTKAKIIVFYMIIFTFSYQMARKEFSIAW